MEGEATPADTGSRTTVPALEAPVLTTVPAGRTIVVAVRGAGATLGRMEVGVPAAIKNYID